MPGGDLDVPKIDTCITGGDKSVAKHMRVGPGDLDPGGIGEPVDDVRVSWVKAGMP